MKRRPDPEPTVIDEAFHNEEVAAGRHRIEPAGFEDAFWLCRCGAAFPKLASAEEHLELYATMHRIVNESRSGEEA